MISREDEIKDKISYILYKNIREKRNKDYSYEKSDSS